MKPRIIQFPTTLIVTLAGIALAAPFFLLLIIGLLLGLFIETLKYCRNSLKASCTKELRLRSKRETQITLSEKQTPVLSRIQLTASIFLTFLLLTSCASYKSITQT